MQPQPKQDPELTQLKHQKPLKRWYLISSVCERERVLRRGGELSLESVGSQTIKAGKIRIRQQKNSKLDPSRTWPGPFSPPWSQSRGGDVRVERMHGERSTIRPDLVCPITACHRHMGRSTYTIKDTFYIMHTVPQYREKNCACLGTTL